MPAKKCFNEEQSWMKNWNVSAEKTPLSKHCKVGPCTGVWLQWGANLTLYFGVRLYSGISHIARVLAVWNWSVSLEIPVRPPTVGCCHSTAINIDLSLTKQPRTTAARPRPSCRPLPICADVTSGRAICS